MFRRNKHNVADKKLAGAMGLFWGGIEDLDRIDARQHEFGSVHNHAFCDPPVGARESWWYRHYAPSGPVGGVMTDNATMWNLVKRFDEAIASLGSHEQRTIERTTLRTKVEALAEVWMQREQAYHALELARSNAELSPGQVADLAITGALDEYRRAKVAVNTLTACIQDVVELVERAKAAAALAQVTTEVVYRDAVDAADGRIGSSSRDDAAERALALAGNSAGEQIWAQSIVDEARKLCEAANRLSDITARGELVLPALVLEQTNT